MNAAQTLMMRHIYGMGVLLLGASMEEGKGAENCSSTVQVHQLTSLLEYIYAQRKI